MFRQALIATSLVLHGAAARAGEPPPCFDAFAQGQRFAVSAHLLAARASFTACVNDTTCPAPPLLKDCADQLAEVAQRIPSVVVVSDNAPPGAQVVVDGAVVATSIDGHAIELDPGTHVIELRAPNHSATPMKVVVGEGQKLKPITITFAEVAPRPRVVPVAPRTSHVASWVFGGVGLASLVAFGVLSGVGQIEYDKCHANGCSSGTIDSLSAQRITAWVALGTGVAAVVVATVLYLIQPTKRRSATSQVMSWRFAF